MVSCTRDYAFFQDVHKGKSSMTHWGSHSLSLSCKAIDIWAVGCILGEMLAGKPLFPGRDYGHQLNLILDVIGIWFLTRLEYYYNDIYEGTPTLDEFYAITSRRSRDYLRALPICKRRSFTSLFPKATPDAIDFMQRTLVRRVLWWDFDLGYNLFQTFDPKKRLTVDEALDHPYLAAYVSPYIYFFSSLHLSHACSMTQRTNQLWHPLIRTTSTLIVSSFMSSIAMHT